MNLVGRSFAFARRWLCRSRTGLWFRDRQRCGPDYSSAMMLAMTDNGSRLVVFDTNSNSRFESILVPEIEALRAWILAERVTAFDATLIGNRDPSSSQVVARTRLAGHTGVETEALDLQWPAAVYSLSHVAPPFRADDLVYGVRLAPSDGISRLGSLELRGERDMTLVPPDRSKALLQPLSFVYRAGRSRVCRVARSCRDGTDI